MEHQRGREKEQAAAPQASYGYGGRFGVEKDRMDKVGRLMTASLLRADYGPTFTQPEDHADASTQS